MNKKTSFFFRNGLTLVLILFFLASIFGQVFTGLNEYNEELQEYSKSPIALAQYLSTGHFLQTTFENWESDFLQMGMYVLLTIRLRQLGSSESKDLTEQEEVDREPDPQRKGAPWAVRQGGIVLTIYRNSLSIAFIFLFILSFFLHAGGSFKNFNEEQLLKKQETVSFTHFMSMSRFWFESFQN